MSRFPVDYWSNRDRAETRPDRNNYGYSNDVKVRKGTYVFHDPDIITPAKFKAAKASRLEGEKFFRGR